MSIPASVSTAEATSPRRVSVSSIISPRPFPPLERDTSLFLQFLEADAPPSVLSGFRALPDNEISRPFQPGVEDIPHPRQVGGETEIVIAGGINQDAVITALAQRQQTVAGAAVNEHPAFVLRDERLIRERRDDQLRELIPCQFHYLFDLAVVHLKVHWFV